MGGSCGSDRSGGVGGSGGGGGKEGCGESGGVREPGEWGGYSEGVWEWWNREWGSGLVRGGSRGVRGEKWGKEWD